MNRFNRLTIRLYASLSYYISDHDPPVVYDSDLDNVQDVLEIKGGGKKTELECVSLQTERESITSSCSSLYSIPYEDDKVLSCNFASFPPDIKEMRSKLLSFSEMCPR